MRSGAEVCELGAEGFLLLYQKERGGNLIKVLAWVTEDAVAGPSAQGHPYAGVVEVC